MWLFYFCCLFLLISELLGLRFSNPKYSEEEITAHAWFSRDFRDRWSMDTWYLQTVYHILLQSKVLILFLLNFLARPIDKQQSRWSLLVSMSPEALNPTQLHWEFSNVGEDPMLGQPREGRSIWPGAVGGACSPSRIIEQWREPGVSVRLCEPRCGLLWG